MRRGSGGPPPRGAGGPGRAGPPGPDPVLMRAIAAHQQGRLPEAEAIYREILRASPRRFEALGLLGYLLHQRNEDAAAIELIDKALAINPIMADAHLWRGMALHRLERFDEAAASYRAVLRLNPQHVDALNNLGALLTTRGDYAGAVDLHRRAIGLKPDRAHAHYSMGVAFDRMGRYDEAIEAYRRAIRHKPDYLDAYINLGVALTTQRRAAEALPYLEKAVALDPQKPECRLNIGKALRDLSRFAEAESTYRFALELRPDFGEARNSLANVLQDFGNLDEALEHLRYVVATQPDYLTAGSNLLMKSIYHDRIDPAAIAEEHRRIGRNMAGLAGAGETAWRERERDPERRLRVGYLSPDFNAHSCAFFLEPLLAAHDRAAVEVYAYSNTARPDAITERIRTHADHWRDVTLLADLEAAKLIAADRIDILVDCAGHTARNRLSVFALKPAPLQGTWLGYPHGTGLPTVDFRLTDAVADPVGLTDPLYGETQIRLPQGFLCYRPLEEAPPPSPGPLARGEPPVFGCFNNAHKIGPAAARLWSEILAALPGARLKLRANQFRDPTVVERYRAWLAAFGIDPARLEIAPWAPTIQEGLADYANIDVALDPFPYNGTTTSCEALWMGVPIVALEGTAHAGRVGASLLTQVGLEALIAKSPAQYRDIALSLARDPARLARLRQELRPRMATSPLCDAPRFAAAVERAYRTLWRDWCAHGTTEIAPAAPPAVARVRHEATEAPAAAPVFFAPGPRAPTALPAGRPVMRVLHNLARTGGTVIAQCIGALPGVALLSEVHPQGARFIDPYRQAQEWYGLLTAEEAARFAAEPEARFLDAIRLIDARAAARGMTLVLRDWSHLDFLGPPHLAAPTGRRGLNEALAELYAIRETCTVRHPIDQWQSTRRLLGLRGRVRLDEFLAAYRRFAELAAELGFVRFEDFALAPETGMRLLAERLDLAYDPVFLERWAENDRVTGDRPAPDKRRKTIGLPPRRLLEPGLLAEFERHLDYAPALALLGYEHPV